MVVFCQAQIPETITYQGHLNASAGGGPVDENVDITVSIYDQRTAQVPPLWTEAHPGVTVSNGFFTIELGSIVPFSSVPLLFDVPYFLGITVGTDAEMTPRVPFTS